MSGHALKKKGHIWKRIKEYASQLEEFKTAELSEKINNHITIRGTKTKVKISNNRLSSVLTCHPQVEKVGQHNRTGNQIWRWVGDDE